MSKTTRQITKHIKAKLSPTAAQIVATNHGYRNDWLFDGDDHQILDVIAYERDDLDNDDIYAFIKNVYQIDIVTQPAKFKRWLETVFQTSVDQLFGYWLTTKDNCLEFYMDTADDQITELTLPNDYLILSDLSVDGCLILTNQPKSANPAAHTTSIKELK